MNTKKKTTEEFISQSKQIHGDVYDYSKTVYVNNRTKVCIVCKEHGKFWQTPKQHLRGQGCPVCGLIRNKHHYIRVKPRGTRYTNDEFVELLRDTYGDKYDYSEVSYVNRSSNVTLICKKHGKFEKSASDLINKKTGCPFCNRERNAEKRKLGREKFIEKANGVFHNLYDYSDVVYVNNYTKVKIKCKKHGTFLCSPQNHLHGRGCPICKSETYVYENRLYNFLKTIFDEKDIIRQYKAEWLTDNKSLDFFVPKYGIAIEHQGSQHYYKMRYENETNCKLEQRIINDKIKYNECISNGVNILYFTYELTKTPDNCTHQLIFEEEELKRKIIDMINF